MGLEKKYVPKEEEKNILKFWEENKIFKFDEKTEKKIYSIDTPPPTVSGRMHLGHAFSYSQQDFIARFKRMKGYEVFYPFGTDDNGLPTEKLVQKNRKINLRKVSRDEAFKEVLSFLDEERPKFIEDWKRLGISADFDLSYSTINEHSRRISQKTFLDLYKKGLIEKKEGPVPWDTYFQTTVAQVELEDKLRIVDFSYVKAKLLDEKNTFVIFATTRPELAFAVLGMSVDENGTYVKLKVKDEFWIIGKATFKEKLKGFDYEIIEEIKGKDLIDKDVLIPISDKKVTITPDEKVKADFGTGIAYFCSYGGIDDIEWVAKHNLKPIELIRKDGTLNELAGKYANLKITEAREKIIKEFLDNGTIIKTEKKEQVVNVGERSGIEIEYIVSSQWFVKYLDKNELFLKFVNELNWYPEFMKSRLENWIKNLLWDWGFVRQRHFGIPVPAWYCKKCGKIHLPNEEDLPVDPIKDKPPVSKCECGSTEFIPEKDVFDTWFTSASSPRIAVELVKDEELKKKLYPMNLRPQAHDIINFWLFYTLAKNVLLDNQNPFKDVIISGWVLDPKGKKMSKSKGNIISPVEISEKYSYDALRYAASCKSLGQDAPFQEKEVQTGIKLVNKLYNANKFLTMVLTNFKRKDVPIYFEELEDMDKWVISKFQKVIKNSTKAFEKYDFFNARKEFENFFFNEITDNYIEIAKKRLWNFDIYKKKTKSAQQTLYYLLLNTLKGLAPFLPFITEHIYQNYYIDFEEEKSIHKSKWPEFKEEFVNEEIENHGDNFLQIVKFVRKYKTEKNLSLKTEIDKIILRVDKKFRDFIKKNMDDLKNVTNTKEILTQLKDDNKMFDYEKDILIN